MPRQNSTGLVNVTSNSSTTGIKTTWSVENVTAPGSAGTEFSISIGATVKAFAIRVRGAGKLQISDTSGQTNTKYWTLIPGNVYQEENLNLAGAYTIYCELNKASEIIEVIKWT